MATTTLAVHGGTATASAAPTITNELALPATAAPGQRLTFRVTLSPHGGAARNTTVALKTSVPAELLGKGCSARRCALDDLTSPVAIPGTLIAPAGRSSLQVTAIADADNTDPVTIGKTILITEPPAPRRSPDPSRRPTRTTHPIIPSQSPTPISQPASPRPTPLQPNPGPALPQVAPQTTPLTPVHQTAPDPTRLVAVRAAAPDAPQPMIGLQTGWLLALCLAYTATIRRLRSKRLDPPPNRGSR